MSRASSLTRRRRVQFKQGRVGFAVGDIHGRADLLRLMIVELEHARASGPDPRPLVIFMGDYVDRGPHSADVIELLLELSDRSDRFETRFLMGNHEAAMLAFVRNPVAERAWLTHGGLETMASYGVSPLPRLGDGDDALRATARNLRAMMPPAHLEFLQGLERLILVGEYAFVHAGVDCGRPMHKQNDDDLLWARDRFLNDKRRASHMIVHGHTPTREPYCDNRRICVDTGAYATNVLSAARFWRDEVGFVTVSPQVEQVATLW